MNDSMPEILLIDDDRASRTLLCIRLQKAGYQVIEAENSIEGIDLYQQTEPKLVLLDAKMPGMNGFECCRKIRKLPEGEHVPILMVTGLEDQTSVIQAFEAGATDYVAKPVQMPILLGRMRYLIQSAQAGQALRNSEERYRSLITNLQEVIFQLDEAGKLVFINPVWHKLMGYSLDASLKKPFEDFLHPVERPRYRVQLNKAWNQPDRCYRHRCRCLTQTGQVRWVDIQLCANTDDQGNVLDIAGRLNDITDRTIREQYRSLEYAVTRVLSHAHDAATAIRRTVQAICGGLGFQLGEFWQFDAHTQALLCQERWHLKADTLKAFSAFTDSVALKPGEGVPGQTWQLEEALWISDLSQDDVFVRKQAAEAAGLCSVLSCPVSHGTEKLGVILLFGQEVSPPDSDLLRMLTILSRQLSQYLKRQQAERILQQQNQRLQLELQRAANYVEGLLPGQYSHADGAGTAQGSVAVDTLFQPSSTLGGDVFDYAWLDDEHLMFHLLDVAGHGVKSALLSVSVLNILRKRTLKGADLYRPITVLEALNEVFQANENGEDYFTLWYGVYNVKSRQLTFASAGHPPGVLVMPNGSGYKTYHLDSDGIAVGLLSDFPFDEQTCEIPPGSSLYIFSDGVYEVPVGNNTDEIWGLDAWTQLLATHKGNQCPALSPLLDEVRRINGEETLEDDFSVLEVSFA